MGGAGSGRRADPLKQFEPKTPIATQGSEGLFLPNHSGITSHPEVKGKWVAKTGDTMTGNLNFGDNIKIQLGDSQDTQLYFNGTNYISDTPDGAHVFLRADGVSYLSPTSDTIAVFHNANTMSGSGKITISGGPLGTSTLNFGNTSTEADGYIQYSHMANSMTFNCGGSNQFLVDTTRTTIRDAGTDAVLRFTGSGGNGQFVYESDNTRLRWNKDLTIKSDSFKLFVGNGYDASVYYNGTDMYINSQEVGSGHIILNTGKTTTGDPTGVEGKIYWNTIDNVIKMYADGGWRTLASW